MKRSALLLVICCIFTLLVTDSCELFQKKGECDGDEMPKAEEPVIYLKINFADLPSPDPAHDPGSGDVLTVRLDGNIQKIHCDEKFGEKFEYAAGFFIEAVDAGHSGKIFNWTEPYQFKFGYYTEKLVVTVDLIFEFKDGTQWKTMQSAYGWYRYKDLKFDTDSFQYYVEAVFGSDNKLVKVN